MLAFNSSGTHPITSPVVTMATADVLQRTSSKLSTFINRCKFEWMLARINGYIV